MMIIWFISSVCPCLLASPSWLVPSSVRVWILLEVDSRPRAASTNTHSAGAAWLGMTNTTLDGADTVYGSQYDLAVGVSFLLLSILGTSLLTIRR